MDKNYYRTRDLSISSFLISTGRVILSGTEKQGKEIYFLFSPQDIAKELTDLYWSDQAPSIQPRQLFQSLRSLKDLIFSR
ncbi:hypothetical protein A3J20_05375 [Candidatus Gottesmanbacteria bacterium RIFCSPLOWO2_02_FULL_42_29]|nr:MAG: hypothetical protein A2781_03285 [Candidatus Gottesmanbacteria bacterium RIFCSPHIGHO2_01_FULL_42_27]OGG39174.1 MAG: hypothetical protein A3J20_05375 [Candidatus Gottesmanbacteria bacterium RIFCSPLOWO2_02_FULL_42_29]